MTESPHDRERDIPPRTLGITLTALLIPVGGTLALPEELGGLSAILWLAALAPAFPLAFYRGERGVAISAGIVGAVLVVTLFVATLLGRQIPTLLPWVVVAYLAIAMGIARMARLLHRQRADVQDLALTDNLTRLPNRRHAKIFLDNEFAAAKRGHPLAVALFDLDGFKAFNDLHGHRAGDRALERFGEILASTTRRMNLSSRFGGEEFLAVLSGSNEAGALAFAERVREALESVRLQQGSLTVSAGVAAYHPSMRSPDELIAAADLALYRAKSDGRNFIRIFGRPLDQSDKEQSVGTHGLRPDNLARFGAGRAVLLIGEENASLEGVSEFLTTEGFLVEKAKETEQGAEALARAFDLVIAELEHPDSSRSELVAAIKSRWPATQVIVITGVDEAQVAQEALGAIVDRHLSAPFEMPELGAHLADALEQRDRMLASQYQRRAGDGEGEGEGDPGERERMSRPIILEALQSLSEAAEHRDSRKEGRASRVAMYADTIGRAAGMISSQIDPDDLRLACALYDLGEIGVSKEILIKEGPLTREELPQVQQHPVIGSEILEPLLPEREVLAATRWHHERWDGSGYPDGLEGDAIPLTARIIAIADALDAMTSPRAYRAALPWQVAVEQISGLGGSQFDPALIDRFRMALPELESLAKASNPMVANER